MNKKDYIDEIIKIAEKIESVQYLVINNKKNFIEDCSTKNENSIHTNEKIIKHKDNLHKLMTNEFNCFSTVHEEYTEVRNHVVKKLNSCTLSEIKEKYQEIKEEFNIYNEFLYNFMYELQWLFIWTC